MMNLVSEAVILDALALIGLGRFFHFAASHASIEARLQRVQPGLSFFGLGNVGSVAAHRHTVGRLTLKRAAICRSERNRFSDSHGGVF